MRIRLNELLKAEGLTPHALALASQGRISRSAAYRLHRSNGHARFFDSDLLDALCDVLKVEPSELLEREKKRRGRLA
jgi:DNA-binding Xre family transcriptional regulator